MGQASTPWPSIIGLSLAALGFLLALLSYLALRRLRDKVTAAATAHRRNEAIVDASGEGVLEMDADGLVRFANPTALRLLGYEWEELLGQDYRQLIGSVEPPEQQDANRLGYT